jgi:hypothetical protein
MQYNNQPPQQQVQLKANDETLKGHYANMAQISHTKEEFGLDFILMLPPAAQLQSRVILSPGHAKRLAKALQENIEKYEGSHGKIAEAEAPSEMGFKG